MSTEQTVFQYTLTVNSPNTSLFIIAGGRHSYSNTSGSHPWRLAVYWDGNLINYAGGAGAVTDSPSVFASIVNAGNGAHTVQVTWYGDPSITFAGSNLVVLSASK